MIPGIPNPYAILAAAGLWLASVVGGALWYGGVVDTRWEAATAKLKAEAQATLTAATEAARKKELEDADKAREIDATHAAAMAAANAGRDDFARKLRVARRGAGSCGAGSGQADNPNGGADAAAGRDDGLGVDDPGNRLRDAALELQAYARACHDWALEVGR